MKKILFVVMAVAAIGFTSCGNSSKSVPVDQVEPVVVNDTLVAEAAEAAIKTLSEQIEAKDVNKLKETVAIIQDKVAEFVKSNPELAKEYVAKVQTFLKENADKVKAVVGNNATVAAAVAAVADVEPKAIVDGLLEKANNAANDAKDAAVDAANQQVDAAKQAVEDKANEAKDAAKDKANEAIDNAAKDAKKALGIKEKE